MPALIHSSSYYSHIASHLLSWTQPLSSNVHHDNDYFSNPFFKKHVFYDIFCHLFAGWSPLFPPSFFLSDDSVVESTLKRCIKWFSRTQPSESILWRAGFGFIHIWSQHELVGGESQMKHVSLLFLNKENHRKPLYSRGGKTPIWQGKHENIMSCFIVIVHALFLRLEVSKKMV